MPRGRPAISPVRKHIGEILFVFGTLTAYDLHRHYIQLFAKTTRRNIYYQLKRGVELQEFLVARVEEEQGNFSWGPISRKIYYGLAPALRPNFNKAIKQYYDKLKEGKKNENNKTTKN